MQELTEGEMKLHYDSARRCCPFMLRDARCTGVVWAPVEMSHGYGPWVRTYSWAASRGARSLMTSQCCPAELPRISISTAIMCMPARGVYT